MARNRRGMEEEDQELNLAPIMNLVIILIPMLLLSVVFLQIGVINITMPNIAMGPPSEVKEEPDEKPLNLTVTVNPKGFWVAAQDAVLPEQPGCPKPGPTICLEKQSVDVEAKFEQARKAIDAGNLGRGEELLKEAMTAYNWRELYNMLVKIKKEFPKETVIKLTADPNIPYAMLVRVMDIARFRLQKDSYAANSAFWSAEYKKAGSNPELLFSDPALSVAK